MDFYSLGLPEWFRIRAFGNLFNRTPLPLPRMPYHFKDGPGSKLLYFNKCGPEPQMLYYYQYDSIVKDVFRLEGHRATSPTTERTPPEPYRKPMPRVLEGFEGGRRFLMGEVPL